MYADNDRKLAVVLNEKQPLPILFNAALHAVMGLAPKLPQDEIDLLSYTSDPLRLAAWISRFPNIVLVARNSTQLGRFYTEARDQELAVNPFVSCMIGSSAEQQIEQTRAALPENTDFIAVAAFATAAQLNPLTRRFSLLRAHS